MKSRQAEPETCVVAWNNEEKLPFSHSDVNHPATLRAGVTVQHLILHSCPQERTGGRAGAERLRCRGGEEGRKQRRDTEVLTGREGPSCF